MKRDVIISIKGTQQSETGSDAVELITEGSLYKKEDKYYIVYKEGEMTGLTGTTTLKIDQDRVSMTRLGGNNAYMEFEQGRRHQSHYDTGFGVFNININTFSLGSTIGEHGGELKVKYSIEINNEYAGSNTLSITVKEANPSHDQFTTVS